MVDTNFWTESLNQNCKYYNENQFETLIPSNCKVFSSLHLNIRSLPKHYIDFMNYLTSIPHHFSVIALTETWLTQENESFYSINSYNSVHSHRNNRVGGGVSLFIDENIQFILRADLDSKFSEIDIESVFIEIPSWSLFSKRSIIIASVYRPPDNNIYSFSEALAGILQQITKEGKICYLHGDFNINLLHSVMNPITTNIINMLYSFSFSILIDKPSRVTSTSQTLIDNIFTNSFDLTIHSGLLYTDISDHLPIFQITLIEADNSPSPLVQYRIFNQKNKLRFVSLISQLSWQNVYEAPDAETSYHNFIQSIRTVFINCFPLIRQNKKSLDMGNSWFTKELKKISIKKNKLYRKYLNNQSTENLIKYKTFKNKFTHMVRKAKKEYYSRKITESTNNIKSTWLILNQLLNRKKKTSPLPSQFVHSNSVLNDPFDISCHFNTFFSNLGPSLSSKIKDSSTSPMDYLSGSHTIINQFSPPNEAEITDIITELKNSAAGEDELSASLIKDIQSSIVKPLTSICEKSINQGIVPSGMKIAKIIPLYKSGDTSSFINYRPISVLPVFSKVLEKVIYKRMYSHLESQNIFYKHQYGFRKKHSSYMALMQLIDHVLTAKDKGEYSLGIFLDLSKAFDTVNYNILLKKLEHYGFHGNTLKWLHSYVHNRQQYVSVNGTVSHKTSVITGVPQGSILGPLLFLIYMNDLPSACPKLLPILFADDTSLFHSHPDMNTLMIQVNQGLNILSQWFQANKLSLNSKKSNYIDFTGKNKKQTDREYKILINNTEISQVSSVRFLGVIVDDKLSWKEHVNNVSKKISKLVGVISKVRDSINDKCLLSLYHSLIYPHITYCNIVWGTTYTSTLNCIHLIQKRFVRMVTFSNPQEHSSPLFKQLKLLNIYQINVLQICIFMYKFEHMPIDLPKSFKNYFVKNSDFHNVNTRQTKDFHTPLFHTTKGQSSIKYKGVELWKKYSMNPTPSLLTYKKTLKDKLIAEN